MSYNIDVDTGYSIGGGFYSFEWETEPPTKEGWYWAEDEDGEIKMINVAPDGIGDFLVGYDRGVPNRLKWFVKWIGPLPPPVKETE